MRRRKAIPKRRKLCTEAFEKAYNSLQSKRNRDAFKAECDAFNEHRRRTEWKFVPSAPKNWLDYDFGTTDYDYETTSD
ncbi:MULTISPECIES: entry exclusion lipoprotein TrbK [unclassified Bartonella]|uniref:entry exclusion lipoprotein TrbK n=1 Tax=unclassified Bartonella TaxID=2645622 RepID=UPI001F021CB6|nr:MULTISPECIES: entry exclusion lipoprotein TrbK [unclassified Bartonella]